MGPSVGPVHCEQESSNPDYVLGLCYFESQYTQN